jgi:hypothetical protein
MAADFFSSSGSHVGNVMRESRPVMHASGCCADRASKSDGEQDGYLFQGGTASNTLIRQLQVCIGIISFSKSV